MDGLTALRQVLELSGKLVPRIAIFHLLITGDGAEIVETDSMPGKQNSEATMFGRRLQWYSRQVSTLQP